MSTQWQHAYEEAIRCIRCGYCQPTCPTYVMTGIEHSVARGRNFLARCLYEDEIELTKEFKNPIFECLLCGACNQNCAPVVKTQDIMMAAREKYIQKMGQPYLQRFVFRELLPNPKRMTRLMKLASFGKRSGLSGLVQALRVFGWFGKNIANMEELLSTFPKKFFRERVNELENQSQKTKLKIGYFVGCGINYAFPDVGVATVNLLRKNNYHVDVLENVCCGLPAAGYGDAAAAKMLARKNVETIEQSGCDIVISECGSCSSFLTDYKHLLGDDEAWGKRAENVSTRIKDINVFLTEFMADKKFKSTEPMTVTYHDPCHLGHYMKITQQPRELIRQIEGIHFQELPESNWCCGGAGTYNIAHNEMSMKILQRKMENLQRTGANVLLTSCPGCIVQLSYGVRKFNVPVKVRHIVELLNDSI
ncbi:MAG TPA: (Fe-S)-binding protein [bacterium]